MAGSLHTAHSCGRRGNRGVNNRARPRRRRRHGRPKTSTPRCSLVSRHNPLRRRRWRRAARAPGSRPAAAVQTAPRPVALSARKPGSPRSFAVSRPTCSRPKACSPTARCPAAALSWTWRLHLEAPEGSMVSTGKRSGHRLASAGGARLAPPARAEDPRRRAQGPPRPAPVVIGNRPLPPARPHQASPWPASPCSSFVPAYGRHRTHL
mmetsp:Transcript_125445/g.360497  ORF Transcript_125445/g.360497 Transcript_125445/m.360497 type:complete len:208 (+) Transcript_125445:40-663(+)